jgi:hypothetical protein
VLVIMLVAVAVAGSSLAAAWGAGTTWPLGKLDPVSYGMGAYGHRMSCGGRLRPSTNAVSAPSLPCGTTLVICFNHRCVDSIVTDRAPTVGLLGLSPRLAGMLGFPVGTRRALWWVMRMGGQS